MKYLTNLLLAGSASLFASVAMAQNTNLRVAMQLEPPNLDPTAGAAQAIISSTPTYSSGL